MPVDELTKKQAEFAQAYVETGNASEAYRIAYDPSPDCKPETIWEEASKTLSRPKVSTRVMELQEIARERHNVTVDSITDELDEAKKLAKDEKQAAAMTSAILGKAKVHGLLVDKKAQTDTKGNDVTRDMSPKDIFRAFKLLTEEEINGQRTH